MKKVTWDLGTAYDLFISLNALNRPGNFGLRPSWAAGVRSRMPLQQRQFFESLTGYFHTPLRWIYTLPPPAKSAGETVKFIQTIPSAEILEQICTPAGSPESVKLTLREIAATHQVTSSQKIILQRSYLPGDFLNEEVCNRLIRAWMDPEDFGDGFKWMISAYYETFFAEEEMRILPILKEELEKKQSLAESIPTEKLLEDLSHGVKLDKVMTQPRLVLVPSFWSSPLILYNTVSNDTMLMVFGCRPPDMTLIPGEAVPDRLLSVLKSLADPTRLQMLHLLSTEPLTAAELARRLRLRPPTVTHHLQLLRLAGLVQIHLEPDGERKYTLRSEALQETQIHLQNYLHED